MTRICFIVFREDIESISLMLEGSNGGLLDMFFGIRYCSLTTIFIR